MRCIYETVYQINLIVASMKRGVAFKIMMCYVLSVKGDVHLWHLHIHGGEK